MKNNTKIWVSVLVIIIAGVLLYFGLTAKVSAPVQAPGDQAGAMDNGNISGDQAPTNTVIADATFSCPNATSIHAVFMSNPDSVNLTLSDGRTMSLPHALSADGARYANADESFVFWNKGNTAMIQENGKTTYENCTAENTTVSHQ